MIAMQVMVVVTMLVNWWQTCVCLDGVNGDAPAMRS
jgi:hypothetical protein